MNISTGYYRDIKALVCAQELRKTLRINMRVVSLAIALSVLSGIWALPLTQEEGADSAEPSPNGCFVTKKDVRTYIV